MALRPVAIALVDRLARNDAGRLHVDAGALLGDDGTFAVDGIAERVDDAAQQALSDGDVDDGAGALDRLAFLDLAVGAEDDDADIVAFEVQRHAARAVLEFDHLAGLHLVEAVGAGDAVADAQHRADFGDFRLGAKGANCVEFGAKRAVDHARPELDDDTADEGGIDLDADVDVLAGGLAAKLLFQFGDLLVGERGGRGDLGAGQAPGGVIKLVVALDHVGQHKQAAL
jgi:hypothetical protein